MPATPERAAFAAEEFRSRTWESEDVRDQYGRVARDTEDLPFESYFDEPNHAQIMLNERGRLIGGHARRFRTTVDKLLLADELDLSSIAPSVILVDDELVVDDLYAAVVGIEGVDFETGRTTLSLWGLIGELPTTVQSGAMQAACTASMEAIQAVTRSAVMAAAGVGASSGTGSSTKSAALASASTGAMAVAGAYVEGGALSAAGAVTMDIQGVEATDTSGRLETEGAGAVAFTGYSTASAVMSAAGAASAGGVGESTSEATNPNYYRTAFLIDATGQSDGTGYAADESRHAHALTYVGDAQILDEKFEFGGASGSITAPHSILWTPGSMFTIGLLDLEFDVVNTGGTQGLISQYEADVGDVSWGLYETGGILQFGWSTTGSSTTNTVNLGPVSAGVLYDVALCWDGITLYSVINGVQGGSAAFNGTFFDSPMPLRFGCRTDNGSLQDFFNGRFAAAYFTRGEVLFTSSGDQAMQSLPLVMDSPALTDSEWPNVLALVGYDADMSRIRDFGPFDLPVAAGGGAAGSVSITLADGTPSVSFDGINDLLRIVDDALLEPGSSPLTIEAYIRHSVANNEQDYLSKYTATSNQRSILFGILGASNLLRIALSSNGTTNTSHSGAHTPTLDVFEHKAMVLTGSVSKIFVNGNQVGTDAAWTSSIFNSTSAWLFGTRGGGGNWLNGYGTQFRITKAARYTANFTAPTGALPIG